MKERDEFIPAEENAAESIPHRIVLNYKRESLKRRGTYLIEMNLDEKYYYVEWLLKDKREEDLPVEFHASEWEVTSKVEVNWNLDKAQPDEIVQIDNVESLLSTRGISLSRLSEYYYGIELSAKWRSELG